MKKYVVIYLLLFVSFAFSSEFIGNIFTEGVSDEIIFLVEKSSKTLKVVKIDNDQLEVVKEYSNVLLGENEGDKEKEGDKKTPEGVYQIVSFIPKEKLSKIYGDGAYPLNYPNPVDRVLGKTGYGIWIHGLDESSDKKFTQGCVALHNGDLNSLSEYNPLNKFVIITKKVKTLSPTDYLTKKTAWLSFLDRYVDSWKNNKFQEFSDFYHIKFYTKNGMNLKSYLAKKRRLMELYPKKEIYYDELEVLEGEKEGLIKFRQLYCAPNLMNEGYKIFYLYKLNNEFLITYESYRDAKENKILSGYVNEFLSKWLDSWKNKDLNKYISFYSDSFRGKGFNKNGWYEYKKKLFEKTGDIDIKISNVKIKIVKPMFVEVSFLQNYSSGDYSDKGVKKLLLSGCPGELKIYRESWRKVE